MLALIFVAACGFAWLRHELNVAAEEQETVEAIRALGGEVYCEQRRWAPNWLPALVGQPIGRHVRWIRFPQGADDCALRLLDHIRNLDELELSCAEPTHDGLESVWRKTDLICLDVSSTEIGDRDASRLAPMRFLEVLDLSRTRITDASIDVFASLPSLKCVELRGTQVTPEGYTRLRSLRTSLNVRGDGL